MRENASRRQNRACDKLLKNWNAANATGPTPISVGVGPLATTSLDATHHTSHPGYLTKYHPEWGQSSSTEAPVVSPMVQGSRVQRPSLPVWSRVPHLSHPCGECASQGTMGSHHPTPTVQQMSGGNVSYKGARHMPPPCRPNIRGPRSSRGHTRIVCASHVHRMCIACASHTHRIRIAQPSVSR